MGATALLATQPPPAGRTVAIVSNVGGAGVLAADACTDLGLAVHHPARADQAAAGAPSSPPAAPSTGRWTPPRPYPPTSSARCSRHSAPTTDVHSVIALVLRTGATGDLLQAIAEADVGVPLAVVGAQPAGGGPAG